jgi:quercetin dioxygenase-like cupin family protein
MMKMFAALVGAILTLGLAALSPMPMGAQNGIVNSALAETQLPAMPAAPVNVRISEWVSNPGATAFTHSHPGGWVYVVRGTHILTMGGRTETFTAGQAVWTPAGVVHTHDWDRAQPHTFWFIGTATNQPPALPPMGATGGAQFRLLGLTAPLEGLLTGSYTVRLSRITLQPESQGAVVRVIQPQVLIGVTGTVGIVTATGGGGLRAEEVMLMQAGSAYLLRNQSAAPAAVLVQALVPHE